jgi:hypothetical protein
VGGESEDTMQRSWCPGHMEKEAEL